MNNLLNSSKGLSKSIHGEFDFPNYAKLEETITSNYKLQYRNYPNTMAVLDLALRSKLVDEHLDYEKIIENHIKFNFIIFLYRLYLSILINIFPKKKKKQLYYNLPNFKFVESAVVEFSERNKFLHKSKNINTGARKYLEIFLLKRPTYNFILNKIIISKFYLKIKREGINKIINDHDLMIRIEKLVNKEIKFLKKTLLYFNIQHLITLGDQDKDSLLAIAAKELEINYIVFAHGYIGSPTLVSIFPLRGNKLILWSKQQFIDLRRVVHLSDWQKLEYIGFPKIYQISEKKSIKISKILLILPGPLEALNLENMLEDFYFVNKLNLLYTNFKKLDIEIITRLHPKDQNNITTVENFKKLFPYFNINTSIEKIFNYVDCVIGYDSSVLIESKMNGIPTFQIYDFMNIEYKGIEILKINDIESFNNIFSPNDANDYNKNTSIFYNNLNMLLSEPYTKTQTNLT